MIGKYIGFCILLSLLCVTAAQANSLAIFRTTLGEMAVELYDDDKPRTVGNFIRLTSGGAYRQGSFNTILHRLEPGFVAQGGGYVVPGGTTSTDLFNSVINVFNYGQVTNEYYTGARHENTYGTIAMARQGSSLDSATSQWFLNLADNTTLLGTNNINGPYTVFGRVIRGTNVLEAMNAASVSSGIVNMTDYWGTNSFTINFRNTPVTFTNGARHPRYSDLLYPGIEIFMIQISKAPGGRLLEWNSPSSLVCRVQYRETLEGPWHTLHLTNGNGQIQSAVDTNTLPAYREYRVRIE